MNASSGRAVPDGVFLKHFWPGGYAVFERQFYEFSTVIDLIYLSMYEPISLESITNSIQTFS